MRKWKIATAVLLASVIAFVIAGSAVLTVSCTFGQGVIRVPDDYPTIQEAIDAATPGSTILVSNGTYVERVVVDKPLKLIGEDKTTTILDGGNGTTITVAADNVHIDGFTIRNGLNGILLSQSYNSTISGNILTLNIEGIQLVNSTGISVFDNIMTECGAVAPGGGLMLGGGIAFLDSHNNSIYGNIITNNIHGLQFDGSTYNLIYRNTMANNRYGIVLIGAHNNVIHHNNFINNTENVDLEYSHGNAFDDGAKGNYWDTYTGLDDGSSGRVAGDGIGDTDLPYLGVDNYPLINPCGTISIVLEKTAYFVGLFSNSTVSKIRFIRADKKITFNVNGPTGTAGYCNVTIPKTLLRGTWIILLNGDNVTSKAIMTENQTHTLINLTYDHGAYNVQVIGTWVAPEFPSPIILSILMILITTLAMAVKKLRRNQGACR